MRAIVVKPKVQHHLNRLKILLFHKRWVLINRKLKLIKVIIPELRQNRASNLHLLNVLSKDYFSRQLLRINSQMVVELETIELSNRAIRASDWKEGSMTSRTYSKSYLKIFRPSTTKTTFCSNKSWNNRRDKNNLRTALGLQ